MFLFQSHNDNRSLHPFPTRRSSDLIYKARVGAPIIETVRDPDFITAVKTAASENNVHTGRASSIVPGRTFEDRKSTRLNSSHVSISYAVFCLKKKNLTLPTK